MLIVCVRCAGCSLLQRIKDWAVKMRKPEVPYSTIEECARHADIIGVSVAVLLLLLPTCLRTVQQGADPVHGVLSC